MSSSEDEMMILTPENAELAIKLAREELGTLFGYTKENQEVRSTVVYACVCMGMHARMRRPRGAIDALPVCAKDSCLILPNSNSALRTLQVGITGEVDFVDLDGVSIIVDLKGRFWHDRKMVLARVEKAIQNRIPECFEVRVRDPRQLEAGNDDQTSVDQFYRHGM